GKLQQPWLGVYYYPITNDIAQQYALAVDHGAWVPPSGVLGQEPVVASGPADKAGLQAGDIITQVDGSEVNRQHSLTSLISQDRIGQVIDLTVVRAGKTTHLKVTLAAAPTDTTLPTTQSLY